LHNNAQASDTILSETQSMVAKNVLVLVLQYGIIYT